MLKIVQLESFGGPEVMQLIEDQSGPPGPGEARVSVGAIGMNRVEVLFRKGNYLPASFPALPNGGVPASLPALPKGGAPASPITTPAAGGALSTRVVSRKRDPLKTSRMAMRRTSSLPAGVNVATV